MAFDIADGSSVSVGKLAANGAPTFTVLQGAKSFTLPVPEYNEVETSHLGSGRVKTFIRGAVDFGEATVSLNYDKGATDTLLNSVLNSGENVQVKFEIGTAQANNAVTKTYLAYVKSYQIGDVETNGLLTSEATFRIVGSVA